MKLSLAMAAVAALGLPAALPVAAQDAAAAAGVSREEVLATATNMLDQPIVYPAGDGAITAEMVTFEPEGHTALHQHPVPSFVYILEGELEVRVEGQEPVRFTPGQAFVEPQGTTMQAFNVADGSTRLLVVYAGGHDHQNMVATQ